MPGPWVIVAEIALGIGIKELQKWLADPVSPIRDHRVDAPTSQEGSPLAIVYGQVRVRQPLMLWYGGSRIYNGSDIDWTEIGNHNVPDTLYGVNMLFSLGIPNGPPNTIANSHLLGMWVGETKLALNLGDGQSVITDLPGNGSLAPNLFEQIGRIQFLAGRSNQLVSDNVGPKNNNPVSAQYWNKDLTYAGRFMGYVSLAPPNIPNVTTIPGYRNQMLVSLTGSRDYTVDAADVDGRFLDSYIVGADPHLPPFSFEVQSRVIKYATPLPAGGDADPAAVIYDVLTSPWGKMNLSPSLIDAAAFGAASTILQSEGHGYSMVIDTRREAKAILQDIVNQTGGVLYQDPYTGLIVYKLMRGGYDASLLTVYGVDDIIRFENYDPGNWRNLNQVWVKYTDRALGYQVSTVLAQNQASAVMQDSATDIGNAGGSIRDVVVEYLGCCSFALAKQLGARDLNLLSQPLAQARIIMKQSAHALRPGDLFKVTFPDYYMTQTIVRVLNVDLGQRDKGEIAVDVLQDVYINDAIAVTPPSVVYPYHPTPEPIVNRVVTEAPYWMMLQKQITGDINSADVQRILAVSRPDDTAESVMERTASIPGNYEPDVLMAAFPLSAKVNTAYAREIGPYDTTTGLVLDTLSTNGSPINISFTANQNRIFGASLILVGTEIMQYESVTDLGGGLVRLNNVWREQCDTASHDHPVGEFVYWIGMSWSGLSRVGIRGWATVTTQPIRAQAVPQMFLTLGSGEEVTDTITIQNRGYMPSRGANFSVAGEVMAGTQGLPASSAPAGQLGYFRKVSNLEEGFAYAWNNRDRLFTNVSRGDDAAETPSDVDPTTWDVYVQKLRSGLIPSIAANDAEVAIKTGLAGSDSLAAALVGGAGYGDLDIILHTRRIKPAGTHGITPSVVYSEWDSPRIRARAERWRNLIGNARFDFRGAGTNITPAWTVASGTPTIAAGVKSITLNVNDCYIGGSGASSAGATQTFDVTGYKARGMTMLLFFYARQLVSGAGGDTVTAVIAALDATNTLLGSTTVNGGAITPPFGNWQRYAGSLVAPAGTTQVRVTFTCGNSNAVVTEVEVRIGHAPVNNVLANSSLDVNLASWTTDLGGWVNAAAIASASTGYAQGGAFAASTLHQDYTLTTGYDTGGGTAIINMWRAQTLASDTGKVTLQCLDVSNAVLASSTTGFENLAVLNQWYRRRLAVDIPAGTTKIRLILDATRTLGAGNSGACFDECILDVHKDLSDARYYRALDFSQPTVQPVPTTWQEFHLSYPPLWAAGILDPVVFAGTAPPGLTMLWSDGALHPTQEGVKMFGQFGASTYAQDGGASTYGIRFDRNSGAGALDYQATNEAQGKFANWDAVTPFTVVAQIRVDEDGFATACGVTGRSGATSGSPGWGLEINASGEAVATLWGSLGNKSVTSTGVKVSDGALHQIALAHDPVGHVLTLTVDNAYSTTVSTASGLGEIQNTLDAVPFRIGRSRDSIDTVPGVICRIYVFSGQSLSAAQMQSMFTYGKDPTGALTTYTRSKEAWTPGLFEATLDGTLVKMAANQVALGFRVDLAADGGSGWGFALCKGNTNLVPSFNFAGGSWVADGSTTLTQSVIDATAKPRGVTVLSPNTTNGFKLIGVTLGAGATAQLAFYARAASGTPTLNIELQNASNVVKQTIGVSLSGGTKWKLYFASFTLWDNSTGTARFRFISASGSTTFDLTHVMWIGPGTEVASLWPDAGQTLADVTATLTENQPKQFNAEGEVIVTGVGTVVSPGQSTIVAIDNAVNSKNWRELLSGASQQPRMDHYDATPANVSSQGTAINWRDTMWTIRGRWCSIGTLDNATTPFGGVVTVANVNSAVYGRTAVFTFDGTVNTRIRLGIGASSALNGYLRSVVVRAREEKLI